MLIASKKSYIDRTKACYSSNALKTIVDALGWDDWDDPNVHGRYYNPPEHINHINTCQDMILFYQTYHIKDMQPN